MHLLLTDRLTCPRCGPAFGLILLADRLVDRRVHEGRLGCPNCRDSFLIESGFTDLRAPPRHERPKGRAGAWTPPGDDVVGRVQALLGIQRGPGTVLALGSAARFAAPLAGIVEDLMAVAIDPDTCDWDERPEVSRMMTAPGLPFFDRTVRGVVADGGLGPGLLWEAARVTGQGSRVVVLDASEGVSSILREAGLNVLAEEAETVVAARG